MGLYLFCLIEWVCAVGYDMFPLVWEADTGNFQNIMHIIVTVLVVVLSVASLALIAVSRREWKHKWLSAQAWVCLALMISGTVGGGIFPKSAFGFFDLLSTFSPVIFNALLGIYLLMGRLDSAETAEKGA